jgi:hypothetical protein
MSLMASTHAADVSTVTEQVKSGRLVRHVLSGCPPPQTLSISHRAIKVWSHDASSALHVQPGVSARINSPIPVSH